MGFCRRLFKRKPRISVDSEGQSGFSMIEIMVTIAILGVVVMAVISQQRYTYRDSLKIGADAEINNITTRIISQIGDEATCTRNFNNVNQNTPVGTITQLVDASSNVIMSVSPNPISAGQSKIKFTGIETKGLSNDEMLLILYFKKQSAETNPLGTIGFSNSITREIRLNTIVSAGKIVNCYANFDLVISSAIQAACQGNSAYYDKTINPPYGGCIHKSVDTTCPNGQFISAVSTDASNKITYTCSDIFPVPLVACSTGQYIVGYGANGMPNCALAFNETCSAGQVLVKTATGQHLCKSIDCSAGYSTPMAFAGFDSGGNILCRQINGIKDCGPGSFANTVGAQEDITCQPASLAGSSCAPGFRVQGVSSTGAINCQPFIQLPFDCGAGNAVYGFDASGVRQCHPVDRPLACDGGQSSHTYLQCLAAGGQIQFIHSPTSQCKFSGATCPAGWNRCENWGSQIINTCNDDATSTFYCSETPPNAYVATRTTPAPPAGYTNNVQTEVTCLKWAPKASSGLTHLCDSTPLPPTLSIQTEVGCY